MEGGGGQGRIYTVHYKKDSICRSLITFFFIFDFFSYYCEAFSYFMHYKYERIMIYIFCKNVKNEDDIMANLFLAPTWNTVLSRNTVLSGIQWIQSLSPWNTVNTISKPGIQWIQSLSTWNTVNTISKPGIQLIQSLSLEYNEYNL